MRISKPCERVHVRSISYRSSYHFPGGGLCCLDAVRGNQGSLVDPKLTVNLVKWVADKRYNLVRAKVLYC